MICKFCQKDSEEISLDKNACVPCYTWITDAFEDPNYLLSRGFYYGENPNWLNCVTFTIKQDKFTQLKVIYNYEMNKTFIMRIVDNYGVERSSKNFLDFGTIMPLTREFLDSIADKIKLWAVFS